MPLAVVPAMFPDEGDNEDPKGDRDVDIGKSDEKGRSDGIFFRWS